MPLDRLIVVNLQSEGKRVEGKYVDGALTSLTGFGPSESPAERPMKPAKE